MRYDVRKIEDEILPPLKPIKGLGRKMERAIAKADAEVMAKFEADRIAMRRAYANDPHRCHCPRCTFIG